MSETKKNEPKAMTPQEGNLLFIRCWNLLGSFTEVCQRLGKKRGPVAAQAGRLRKRGVRLKKHADEGISTNEKRIDYDQLRAVAEETLGEDDTVPDWVGNQKEVEVTGHGG